MAGAIITGLAKTLALTWDLVCLARWIAQPAWDVFLGGLLAVRGLSGLLAGADSRVCQGHGLHVALEFCLANWLALRIVWIASITWVVTSPGLHDLCGLSLGMACTRRLEYQRAWLAHLLWVVADAGLHDAYGQSGYMACSGPLGCPQYWLAPDTWVVSFVGLHIELWVVMGSGLLAHPGLSGILACATRVDCLTSWLAR